MPADALHPPGWRLDERMPNSSPERPEPGADRPAEQPAAAWPALHPTTQAAFNRILWERGLPRAEIARQLGVSRTRLTSITRDLQAAGLVTTAGLEQRSVTGRPAEMIVARYDAYHFLGLHVDGEVATIAAVTLLNEVVWQRRSGTAVMTPQGIHDLSARWHREAVDAGLRVAGLAVCGPWNRYGKPANASGSLAFKEALDDLRLPGPVWVEDDIFALTALEQWPMLAEDQDSMVMVSVGPEVAFSVVTDRKIVSGAHGRAGRFGHLDVAGGDASCPYGHRGCLWAVSSTTAILAAVPDAPSVREVAARAVDGDLRCRHVLERAAAGLGVAVGQLINLIDPDKVVVVGNGPLIISVAGEHFRTSLSETAPTGGDVEVNIAEVEDVEWARAAASLAVYRTLTAGTNG
jgi:predicted NBD/HSP70 family sugar kinase